MASSSGAAGCLRAAGAARDRLAFLFLETPTTTSWAAVPRRFLSSSVTRHGPPGMEPLPEDAPRQTTPPRLGEPDPVGPPTPTPTPKEKITGGSPGDGGVPDDVPDTTPPPDVPLPPASPDGSNV